MPEKVNDVSNESRNFGYFARRMTSLPDIDRLAAELAAGDLGGSEALFAAHGEIAPKVVWDPQPGTLDRPQLEFLLGFWRERCSGEALPPPSCVNPFELKPALGYIMLLDVVDGGRDFRYALYGSLIAERAGRDWTGRLTSEMAATSYTGHFYTALYRAALVRRVPFWSSTASPKWVPAKHWSRLALPLAGDDGVITRFMIGNVPGDWRPPE